MDLDTQQLDCLQEAIYHEARGESYHGQLLVGFVIDNRVHSPWYRDTFCGVIQEPSQFSYIDLLTDLGMYEGDARERSRVVAEIVMTSVNPLPSNVLLYHEKSITPNWDFTKTEEYVTIDNHVSYKEFR